MFHEVPRECISRCLLHMEASDIRVVVFHPFLEGVLRHADVELVTKSARGFVNNTTASAIPIIGTRIASAVTLSIHKISRHYVSIQFGH